MADLIPKDDDAKGRVLESLEDREVAILHTDSAYLLAVNGQSKRSVTQIYVMKARGGFKPLPVLATPAKAGEIAHVPDFLKPILPRLWPGALSIVLRRKETVPRFVTDRETVALFCPDVWTWELAEEAPFPIAATSANLAGEPPFLTPEEALKQFGSEVAVVVDGGKARRGVQNTLLDLSGPKPVLLREGWFPTSEVRRIFGEVEMGSAP